MLVTLLVSFAGQRERSSSKQEEEQGKAEHQETPSIPEFGCSAPLEIIRSCSGRRSRKNSFIATCNCSACELPAVRALHHNRGSLTWILTAAMSNSFTRLRNLLSRSN